MFKPSAGELLEGVIDGLRQSVLPALPPGAAERQLRAALHALGRLQRSWDLLPDYVKADGDDMRATLGAVLMVCGSRRDAALRRVQQALDTLDALGTDGTALTRGVHSSALAAQCAIHERLQRLLVEVDGWLRAPERAMDPVCVGQARVLDELYARMNERQLEAWAVGGTEA